MNKEEAKQEIKHINGTVLYEGKAGMTTRQMLEKATKSKIDLHGANLRGADLRGADLRDAKMGAADLRGADLYGANLHGANLHGANLRDAKLGAADLRDADLGAADLGAADLGAADLRGADLGEKFGNLVEGRPCFQFGPIGSRSDYLVSFLTDKGIVVKAGCFTGFLDEFSVAVENTHGDSNHGQEYAMAVRMIEAHAALWMPRDTAEGKV